MNIGKEAVGKRQREFGATQSTLVNVYIFVSLLSEISFSPFRRSKIFAPFILCILCDNYLYGFIFFLDDLP